MKAKNGIKLRGIKPISDKEHILDSSLEKAYEFIYGKSALSIKGFIHDISNAGSTVFIEPISVFEMNNELNRLKLDEELEIEKILYGLSSLLIPYIEELVSNTLVIRKIKSKIF